MRYLLIIAMLLVSCSRAPLPAKRTLTRDEQFRSDLKKSMRVNTENFNRWFKQYQNDEISVDDFLFLIGSCR